MRRRYAILIAGALFVILILVLIGFNGWAPMVAQFLIVNENPGKSDLIIVLSGTDDGGRIRYGVSLYKNSYVPKILFSGSSYLFKETGMDLMKIYAVSLGVPETDIWVDHDSGSTAENAIFAREMMEKNGAYSALIVTSPTHSRRTRMVFQRIFQKEISFKVSSDASTFDARKWWKTPWMAREVSYEYFVFLWYGLFGW